MSNWAFEGKWDRVKLYFMLGLPTETEEDIEGIADLAAKLFRSGTIFLRKIVHEISELP